MPIPFASKKELDSQKQTYNLLIPDDYQFIVRDVKIRLNQPKYNGEGTEDLIDFTLEIVGLRDGSPAYDEKKENANGRKMWFTARPASIGFTQAGVASITRQFVGYAMGMEDLEADFSLEDWNDLVGKTVYGEIITKTNTKGVKVNRIARFLKPPRRK